MVVALASEGRRLAWGVGALGEVLGGEASWGRGAAGGRRDAVEGCAEAD